MHTTQLKTITIHHNGDFYGDIEVFTVSGDQIEGSIECSIEDILNFAEIVKKERAKCQECSKDFENE